jgi:hypothetical protein
MESMSDTHFRSSRGGFVRLALASMFGLALIVGGLFRFVHLTAQLPIHDEWHALDAVARQDASSILRGFRFSDYSVAIALYLEALSHGPGITEAGHLLPFALIGLASCVVLPLLVRIELGWPTALVFCWLLATAPLLVYYSRVARSYAFAAPAAFAAVLFFDRWWRKRAASMGALYVLTTAFVVWMNSVYLPFCLSPFLIALARRPDREGFTRILRLGALAFVATAILITPTLSGGFGRVASKFGAGHFEAAALWPSAKAALGMAGGGVAGAHLLLAASGWACWWKERCALLEQLVVASALQLSALVVVAPKDVQLALVLTRYLLPGFLVILLLVAHGAVRLVLRSRRRLVRRISAFVFSIGLLAAMSNGPLLGLIRGPQNFGSSILYYRFYYDDDWLAEQFGDPPEFYRRVLASAPAGTIRVVEAPYSGRYAMPYARYQLLHRQPVAGGFLPAGCSGPTTPELPTGGSGGFHFATLFSLDDVERLKSEGVRYVILHRRPRDETPWKSDKLDLVDMERCTEILGERMGPPVYVDRRITVFAVDQRR